jgi:hypothetical protein
MNELRKRRGDARTLLSELRQAQKLALEAEKKAIREERIKGIILMYSNGNSLEEVGGAFGVTRERVRQILKEEGIARRTKRDYPQTMEVEERICQICGTKFVCRLKSSKMYCNRDCACRGRAKIRRDEQRHRRAVREAS